MAWFAKYDGVDGSPMADGLSNTFSFGERPIFVPETGDEVLVGFEFGDVSHDVDGRDFLIWQRGGSPSPNDTFVFIPQSSNDGAANNVNLGAAGIVTLGGDTTYGGTVTLNGASRIQVLDDGLLLPAVKTDDDDGAAGITKAGAVTLTATLADGTPQSSLAGTLTFGGTVTLADDSRIQVLDDGLLLHANNVSLGAAGTVTMNGDVHDDGLLLPAVSGNNFYGGLVTMDSSASDTVNNGGDIILTGFGTLG